MSLPGRPWAIYIFIIAALFFPDFSPLDSAANQAQQVYETELNDLGSAYEVNLSANGAAWISDFSAGEIRYVSGDGSQQKIYHDLGYVSDARSADDLSVWYVEQDSRSLVRLDTALNTITSYPLPVLAANGFGTALGTSGSVWISDFSNNQIYRIIPSTLQRCAWDTSVLTSWGSPYLLFDGTFLWFSDFYDTALLRLNPASGMLERWELPSGWVFEANALLSDGAGGLWFADLNNASIGRLDLTNPSSPRLLRYSLPAAFGSEPGQSAPVMLARQGGRLHFSVLHPGALGSLDPAAAAYTLFTPGHSQATLTPDCQTVTPGSPQAVEVDDSFEPVWTESNADYTQLTGGWRRLAVGDPDSYLWGLAIHNDTLWAVDNGRQVLLRVAVSSPHEVFLPLVKR